MKIVAVVHIVLALSVGLLAFLVIQSREAAVGRSGQVVSPGWMGQSLPLEMAPRPEQELLTFKDHTGRDVSEADFRGRYLLVFFGYTSCPDICPGNLAAISSVMRSLGSDSDRVQPLFVSFDPERDTTDVIADYVGHFDSRIVGLTGTPEQIAAAARAYGVYYAVGEVDEQDSSRYLMDHTSQTYLVGPGGEGVLVFRHGTDPEEIVSTIREILAKTPEESAAWTGEPAEGRS